MISPVSIRRDAQDPGQKPVLKLQKSGLGPALRQAGPTLKYPKIFLFIKRLKIYKNKNTYMYRCTLHGFFFYEIRDQMVLEPGLVRLFDLMEEPICNFWAQPKAWA